MTASLYINCQGRNWMKIKKKAAFGLVLAICANLLVFPFSAHAAQTPYITENGISSWAIDGVLAAYEAGLVAQSFDLGEDYSVYITRLQLARLAVDFVAVEKNSNALTLADAFELVFQAPAAADPTPDETTTAASEPPPENSEAEDVLPPGIEQPEQAELPELESSSFLDTKSLYAELASKLNIMNGFDGLFRPNDMITRAEAAAVLQHCMAALGVTEANAAPMTFADTYAVPRWAVESLKFVSGRTGSDGTALMGGSEGVFFPGGQFHDRASDFDSFAYA